MMKKDVTSCDKLGVGARSHRSQDFRMWLHYKSVRMSNAGNWSVLVPAGKETNKDTVSSGERKQYRANWILCSNVKEMWCCRTTIKAIILTWNLLESYTIEGDSPVEERGMVLGSILSSVYWILCANLGGINFQP